MIKYFIMRTLQITHWAILLCFILPSCAKPQTFDEYKKSFNQDFKKELIANHVANTSYAVLSKDSIIFQSDFSATKSKTDANTPFLIGSITKVFTAVAVMQLYEQGKIDIDKPVSNYITDFRIKQRFPESTPITIRAVLIHSAGIPSDRYLHKFSQNPHDFNEILPYLNSQYTCYPVGKLWAYSNLGYALMGILIERVSGLKYEDYLVKYIFNPLKMNASGIYADYSSQKSLSIAYDSKGNNREELPLLDKPAGAIYSTVNDMTQFCRSFIDGKELLLKNETLAQMYELQNGDNLLDMDHRSAICFNLKNKAYELGRVLEHGGATMFHRAQMVIAPDAGLAAVMLSDSPNGKNNAWKLDEQFMVQYCKVMGIQPDRTMNTEKKIQFTPISSKDLKSFAGNYAMPGMVCRFDWKNEHLSPTINGQNFYMVPHDSNSFVPAKRFMGIMLKSKKMYFLLEEIYGEKLFIQAMPWGSLSIIGTKTATKPVPEIWKNRTGKYSITNSDKGDASTLENGSIAIENGFVVLKYGFHSDVSFGQNSTLALDLKNEWEAFVIGNGRGGGESVIFDETEQSFKYMGLKFEKQ
jgi:CubicO group peptidase (beta-lactamase class C family)